jgi:hypothetical protein
MPYPPQTLPEWERHYRLIPSCFPPIDLFEELVEPALLDELYYLEGLTNDRLRDEAGDIALVDPADRICGPGSTVVMAAFTHTGVASRFSDGSHGIYYAADTLETAIAESKHARARFLTATDEAPGDIDMRVYIGTLIQPLHDVRGDDYVALHDPDDWQPAQAFGGEMKRQKSWGILYRSVRLNGGECIAVLRPPAVSIPLQGPHLGFVWDGRDISHIYEKRPLG